MFQVVAIDNSQPFIYFTSTLFIRPISSTTIAATSSKHQPLQLAFPARTEASLRWGNCFPANLDMRNQQACLSCHWRTWMSGETSPLRSSLLWKTKWSLLLLETDKSHKTPSPMWIDCQPCLVDIYMVLPQGLTSTPSATWKWNNVNPILAMADHLPALPAKATCSKGGKALPQSKTGSQLLAVRVLLKVLREQEHKPRKERRRSPKQIVLSRKSCILQHFKI